MSDVVADSPYANSGVFIPGEPHFFRLDGYFIIGTLKWVDGNCAVLEDACWSDDVANCGAQLRSGSFKFMFPYPAEVPVLVNLECVKDACRFRGKLPYFLGMESPDE